MPGREVFIISYSRTPIGKFQRSLAEVEATKLGGIAVKSTIEKASIPTGLIDEVIMGNVLQAGLGQNPARQAAYHAGIPAHVNGYTVNKVCASGMKAVANAVSAIKAGDAEVIVAGGMESMSRSPFILPASVRTGVRLAYRGGPTLIDCLTHDGLTSFIDGKSMAEIAEAIARARGVTRRQADEFAYLSHVKAHEATVKGYFKDEITPVNIKMNGKQITLEHDEGIRSDTTLEKLSKLPPAFEGFEIVTAGNAPPLSDGAAALVLASGEAVKRHKLEPVAKILGYAWAALDYENFVEAPIPATKKLLEKLGMNITDFDLFEHNEAFAVSSILVARGLEIPLERLNVFGGALALGHPLGASGARIIITLINALKKYNMRRGLATICHGGGGAVSIAVELE